MRSTFSGQTKLEPTVHYIGHDQKSINATTHRAVKVAMLLYPILVIVSQ